MPRLHPSYALKGGGRSCYGRRCNGAPLQLSGPHVWAACGRQVHRWLSNFAGCSQAKALHGEARRICSRSLLLGTWKRQDQSEDFERSSESRDGLGHSRRSLPRAQLCCGLHLAALRSAEKFRIFGGRFSCRSKALSSVQCPRFLFISSNTRSPTAAQATQRKVVE